MRRRQRNPSIGPDAHGVACLETPYQNTHRPLRYHGGDAGGIEEFGCAIHHLRCLHTTYIVDTPREPSGRRAFCGFCRTACTNFAGASAAKTGTGDRSMAYSEAARTRRRCTGTRRDGTPCRAWACWDDAQRCCASQAGRHHTGPLAPAPCPGPRRRTRYTPCVCGAYGWPHRPAGGQCRWPEPPLSRCTTAPGTHRQSRWRRRRR
jgi:hypothetical protein